MILIFSLHPSLKLEATKLHFFLLYYFKLPQAYISDSNTSFNFFVEISQNYVRHFIKIQIQFKFGKMIKNKLLNYICFKQVFKKY
jgi:hypothetical protein